MDSDDVIVNSLLEEDNNEVIVISTETQMCSEGEEKKKVVIPRIFMKNDVSYALTDDFDVTGSLVGMKAEKWEHLQTIYKRHAKAIGFSSRIGTCRRVNGTRASEYERYFVCSCQGEHGNGMSKPKSSNTKKMSITRCKCMACIRTQINENGLWEVVNHTIDHNHPLTPPPLPEWQHHHRSERKITREEGEVIEIMTQAMVPPSVQYRVAAVISGGEEFVGHTKRDHINFVNRLNMHAIEGGDVSTLVNLLNKRQTENPGFFYRIEFGEGGRLCHLFWRDSIMKEDYLLYHDVVIFDTTYRTNRYNLICGALVGINNHRSNIMFGCAFLSDEKTETFEWLFNSFNESMGEDVIPTSIFTDQDLAMTNAIEKVYPSSKHRLCQWHIHQNAISHFGSLRHDRTFQQVFNKCLNDCYSEAEFKDTWGTMVEEYEMVKRWRSKEERNEFNSIRSRPTSVYPMVDLLDHAAQVYTLALFRVFENEFATGMGTRTVECGTYGSTLSYIVHSSACSEIPHHVSFDCDNLLIECTCRKFQEMGMLCYHSIRILYIRSISEIPDRYILKRWTKFAKKDVWDRLLPNDRRKASINDVINWRREKLTNFNNLITKCLNVLEARVILDKAYATTHEAVHTLSTSTNVECPTTSSTQTTNQILDPKRSITKGKSRRKKSGITKRNTKGAKQTQSEAPTYIPIPCLF
ncbi:hypothetical protein RND81_14G175500 [Saponaria officinalis]|uniref:SWIM-type domain-containing protein n=1 Tax=Saponaria officinalis TaxID=3572 RepID=A0AAW1GR26_SAPOF